MPDNTPTKTPKKYDPSVNLAPAWKPGQSGNPKGRPKSARAKLSESFIKALAKDFKTNGVDAIQALRAENPKGYIDAVGKLVPREDTLTLDGGVAVTHETALDLLNKTEG